MPAVLILDSEAVSVLANPNERGIAKRRAQALIAELIRLNGILRIPAVVLTETYRGSTRKVGVDRLLNQGAGVITTGRKLAMKAADLLERDGLNSAHTVDACVVATAIAVGRAIIATGDPADIQALAVEHPNIVIWAL